MNIFIFRSSQLLMNQIDSRNSIFEIEFYIRNWFSSSLEISDPKNDLLLARRLLVSGDKISLGALKKLKSTFQSTFLCLAFLSLMTQSRVKKRGRCYWLLRCYYASYFGRSAEANQSFWPWHPNERDSWLRDKEYKEVLWSSFLKQRFPEGGPRNLVW